MSNFVLSPNLMDPDALFVVRRLQQHQHVAYIVGGSVRDLLIGRTPKDFDVATSATPQQIRRLFSYTRLIGRRFKLVHVVFRNNQKIIETSTFRRTPPAVSDEDGPADLLIRNDNVYGTPEEDAFRRDFTVNGIFYDPVADRIIDFVGGIPDVQTRTLRAIGDPDIRFQEDPVRILRAIRFAAKLGFDIEPKTLHFMREHRDRIRLSAPRRIIDETWKLLLCGAAADAVELARGLGVLQLLAPEIAPAFDDGRLNGILMSLLRAFDANPPVDPRLAMVVMAPILLYGSSEAFWDSLDAPWRQRISCFDSVTQQMGPVLQRYGFSKLDRALVRDLLQITLRLGHPDAPQGIPPKVRARELFEPAFWLWQSVWRSRSVPEERLIAACEVLLQSSPSRAGRPHRRRRRKPRAPGNSEISS